MFCPNCGNQNADTAQTCVKCGFALKGAAAPKFKGTMLMMNQGALPGGATGAGPATSPQPPVLAPPVPPPRAMSKVKGTMVGVAPPSVGAAPAPPEPVLPPPAREPIQSANPLAATFAMPQAEAMSAFGSPKADQGGHAVPPPPDFPGAPQYGAPPQAPQAPQYGGPSVAAVYGAPPQASQGYGGGGYGPSGEPSPQGYGAPSPEGQFGPMAGYGAAAAGFGGGYPGAPMGGQDMGGQGMGQPMGGHDMGQPMGGMGGQGMGQPMGGHDMGQPVGGMGGQGMGQPMGGMGQPMGGQDMQGMQGQGMQGMGMQGMGGPMMPGGGMMQGGGMVPGGGGGEVNTTLPLVLSIVSLFCCGLGTLLGIGGLVFAIQAGNAKKSGDMVTAAQKAKLSTILAAIGIGIGILGNIVGFILRSH